VKQISKDKTFKKPCYLEISKKKRKIIVETFLEKDTCGQPVKRFIFDDIDNFRLNGIYTDITVEDYENSYS